MQTPMVPITLLLARGQSHHSCPGGYWQEEREVNSKPNSLLQRCSSPYSDGECSFMTSMASAECAMAAPALISAATQMASMISFSVAPF
jgi:hypothetical protein